MTKLKSSLLLFIAIVVASMEFPGSTAREYMVGEYSGWKVPSNPSFYVRWAAFHIFKPNDVLVFNFTNGLYNVAEVTKEAYLNCNGQNPISLEAHSPARFTIRNPNHFYICTIGQNCRRAQKLGIKVSTVDNNNSSAMSFH